ncbi:hypothetical protein DFP72DRAFT_815998, partial [Ephemerocybe angulata]
MADKKTVADMPWPNTKGAPSYDGDPRELNDFFEQYEAVAAACNVTDNAVKIKKALRYVEDQEDKEEWRAAITGETMTFDAWKAAVLGMYSREEKEFTVSLSGFTKWLKKQAKNPVKDLSAMNAYQRSYLTRVKPLITKQILSEKQKNMMFWDGLHNGVKRRLGNKVSMSATLDDDDDEPTVPTVAEIMKAAKVVFSDREFYLGRGPLDSEDDEDEGDGRRKSRGGGSEDEREREIEKRDAPVVTKKRVSFEMGRTQATGKDERDKELDAIEELGKKMRGLSVTEPAYAGL